MAPRRKFSTGAGVEDIVGWEENEDRTRAATELQANRRFLLHGIKQSRVDRHLKHSLVRHGGGNRWVQNLRRPCRRAPGNGKKIILQHRGRVAGAVFEYLGVVGCQGLAWCSRELEEKGFQNVCASWLCKGPR